MTIDEAADKLFRDLPALFTQRRLAGLVAQLGEDEALSEAGLAIAQAMRTWKPDGKAAFQTYALQAVRNTLIKALKRLRALQSQEETNERPDALDGRIDALDWRSLVEREKKRRAVERAKAYRRRRRE